MGRRFIIFIIVLCFIVPISVIFLTKDKTKEPQDASNIELEEEANEVPENHAMEPTPTNPPDTVPYSVMINGTVIEIFFDGYRQISPGIQELINHADLIGVTAERVAPNKVPTEELQTNFISEGSTVYCYSDDSGEYYLFIDKDKTDYGFFQTPE